MLSKLFGQSVIPLRKRLSFRLARNTILAALALGTLFAFSQLRFEYRLQDEHLDSTAAELFSTVESAAAHILWNLDRKGGHELALGLLRHKEIVKVEFLDQNGKVFASVEQGPLRQQPTAARRLFGGYRVYRLELIEPASPLSAAGDPLPIGTLNLTLDPQERGSEFLSRGLFSLAAGLFRILLLAAVLLFIFHLTVTRSLLAVGRSLVRLDPKNLGEKRIKVPAGHGEDELGLLVTRTNDLLHEVGRNLLIRKQAEDALKVSLQETEEARDKIDAILRSVADGLIVTDPQCRIVLTNRRAEVMLGINLKEAVGQSLDSQVSEKSLIEKVVAASGGKEEGEAVDLTLQPSEGGSPAIVQARSAAVRSKEGAVTGVVTLLRDITRERELDGMKDEFISTAAHELRTPLTSVMGYTELLLNPEEYGVIEKEQQREFLSLIYGKGERLARLIDDLLDLSRINAGRELPLSLAPCDLSAILREAVDTFRKISDRHDFDLLLPDRPIQISADSQRLSQIFENLVSNAVKFSPDGGTVRVGARRMENAVHVFVEDEGIGMTPEQTERLFDEFYRVDASTTAPEGLGLGMSIVKTIIERHGGTIDVKSEPGGGTRVSLSLPIGMT